MTEQEYRQLPGVRWTHLKAMAVSPAHYQAAIEVTDGGDDEDTPARRIGRAAHCLLLDGPTVFANSWATWCGDRRSKAWKEFEAKETREILSESESTVVINVVAAVQRHPIAKSRLIGAREQAVTWRDEHTGLRCKARIDLQTNERLIDLKTTGRLDHREFAGTSARLRYHAQLAFYGDGLRANGWSGEPEPLIVGVETSRPWDVVVYELPSAAVDAGRREYRRLLELVAECQASGTWPGRAPDRIVPLELPEWAFGGFDDGLDMSGLEEA